MHEGYRVSADTDFSATRDRPISRERSTGDDFSMPGRITISVRSSSTDVDSTGALKAFKAHERKWKRETQYISSLSDKYLHPSYARIIGMGPSAVPMILQSLKRQPNDWFYALRAITGDNPVDPNDAGDVAKMSQAWLEWGARRGFV
jgi:hypothetical protein